MIASSVFESTLPVAGAARAVPVTTASLPAARPMTTGPSAAKRRCRGGPGQSRCLRRSVQSVLPGHLSLCPSPHRRPCPGRGRGRGNVSRGAEGAAALRVAGHSVQRVALSHRLDGHRRATPAQPRHLPCAAGEPALPARRAALRRSRTRCLHGSPASSASASGTCCAVALSRLTDDQRRAIQLRYSRHELMPLAEVATHMEPQRGRGEAATAPRRSPPCAGPWPIWNAADVPRPHPTDAGPVAA